MKSVDLSKYTLLKQGAEAKLHVGTFLGKKAIVKERFSKKYRHPDLDQKINRDRLKAEARALARCKTIGVRTPTLYLADAESDLLVMEHLDQSPTCRDYIRQLLNNENTINEQQKEVLVKLGQRIGTILAKLHNNNVIHGDLTTSNILVEADGNLCLIDFGLGYAEGSAEDKGVDLYVLERALISAHPNTEFMFAAILSTYKLNILDKLRDEVVRKFEDIRMRGRKRTMVG